MEKQTADGRNYRLHPEFSVHAQLHELCNSVFQSSGCNQCLPTGLSGFTTYPDCYSLVSVHAWMCKYMFEIVHTSLFTWGTVSLEKQKQNDNKNIEIFKPI